MNENKLYTLKEIAEDLRVNYRTLLSCKDRFEDFVHGVPVARIAKYPGELIDFFKMVFALLDVGYSTEKIRDLLLNGVQSENDRFIETWLETWREALLIKRKKAANGNNVIPIRQDQDDGMTDGSVSQTVMVFRIVFSGGIDIGEVAYFDGALRKVGNNV